MKKQFTIYLLILTFFFFLTGVKIASAEVINCQGWTHPTEICPNIESISPETATIDDTIVITGSNFEQEQGSNKLSFWYDDPGNINGGRSTFDATGEIISWSDNEIRYKLNFNSWDGVLAQKNISICVKKCNNINGCDESCYNNTIYVKPRCSSYVYSPWSDCSEGGQQTRTVISYVPDNCSGGASPILTQSCDYSKIPKITSISPDIIYPGSRVNILGQDFGFQCYYNNCYINVSGNTFVFDDFMSVGNWSTNKIEFIMPTNAVSGYIQVIHGSHSNNNDFRQYSNKINFILTPSAPTCTINNWSCASWSLCSSNGAQTRTCNKISNCEGGTQSPASTQSCVYTPACSQDTWKCGNWGTCSPQGVQTRSCTRTYDCPSAETAAPATSQYCVAPNQPKQQSPTEDLGIVNQDSIIKSTVKLICPVSSTMASQGSGTVINSTGLILTNKHVIDGTAGCWVGFIDNYNDEPYFGDRQIADIYKISSDADAAVLKLRNPSNKTLTSINISQSNSGSIKLGETLTTYGYPAKFGTKITYTSGDFSGVDGNYLKTTAIIEHGNSGGGAYLKNGSFIGIPTAVIKGSLNSMGYLLSVNKVNSWLNNSIAYNYNSNNNNYSRVSAILDNMDLSALGSLGLFITGDEANIKTATESQTVIAEEKKLITKIDNKLSKRISGNILLQVEKNGEGWYVYPDDKKKYYLGRPADAFSIMRNLGLGIKHSELSGYLNTKFLSRLSGKIMLDVEQNGEAYYIYPKNLKGYFLSRPSDAFKVMRDLGLGITNADIRKIGVGEIK